MRTDRSQLRGKAIGVGLLARAVSTVQDGSEGAFPRCRFRYWVRRSGRGYDPIHVAVTVPERQRDRPCRVRRGTGENGQT